MVGFRFVPRRAERPKETSLSIKRFAIALVKYGLLAAALVVTAGLSALTTMRVVLRTQEVVVPSLVGKPLPEAGALVHTLKGSARAIGAFAVAEAAERLEAVLADGGEPSEALAELADAVALARTTGDPWLIGWSVGLLGIFHLTGGNGAEGVNRGEGGGAIGFAARRTYTSSPPKALCRTGPFTSTSATAAFR